METDNKVPGFLRQILSVSSAHFINDFYSSFLAPLLPVIMDTLSINLTSAGLLTSISRFPSIFNPLIGYLADKKGTKYFVVFAPALTSTFMSLIGQAHSFWSLALLLFLSGMSSSLFHSPSPGFISRISDTRKGFGLSLYTAGGGTGRGLGPLVAVWAAGLWGLEGLYRLMFIGWGVSIVLFLQFKKIGLEDIPKSSLRKAIPLFRRFFFPLALVLLLRSSLLASLGTYLPVFMVETGAPLWLAGAALSIFEISGVIGALVLGPFSDKIGRRKIINLSMLLSSLLIPLFLQIHGWLVFPVLILLGFFSVSTGTIFMALVQDNFQEHRATGNSVYILISFLSNAVMLVLVGFLGDQLGLSTTYLISAGLALFSIPVLKLLPSAASLNHVQPNS